MMETKLCPKCSTERPKTEFSSSVSAKDGLQSWCKPCNRAYQKARYVPRTDGQRHPWAKP